MKLSRFKSLTITGITFLMLLLLMPLSAQPSGGPYGPVRQKYDLPSVKGKIYYAAPEGNAGATGESLSFPITIEAAFEKVRSGDAIILRGGTYRTGNLILNQGITIQPYGNEQPVLKGTRIAREWINLGNGLWTAIWPDLFPQEEPAWFWSRARYGKDMPLCRLNNDMVFIDGKFLQAVTHEGEVDENSFYIDYNAKLVYIGTDPADRLVEISAFDVGLNRIIKDVRGISNDKIGPVIRGITFTQYVRAINIEGTTPNSLSEESKFGKDVVGTILENCTISFCSRVGAYLRGDKLIMRNCKVSDTSTEGVFLQSSADVLLENNIFTRNNIEQILGYYPAAVKIFNQTHRVTCRNNLVINKPYSNGIWYDVGNVDGVFINNWVENIGTSNSVIATGRSQSNHAGFFFEISNGTIVAGNVFVNCDVGIRILNSSDAKIYQNTFFNSMATISRNERNPVSDKTFTWHSSTGPAVEKREGHIFVNNLLVGDENYHRPLLTVSQPNSLCKTLSKPQLTRIDNNVYVRGGEKKAEPLILWSPANNAECQAALESPADLLRMYPEFETKSQYFTGDIPLFKSAMLGNYQLLPSFPGKSSASLNPPEINRVLNLSKRTIAYIGAYPFSQ